MTDQDTESSRVPEQVDDDPERKDHRRRGDWVTRYTDLCARRGIRLEACYVTVLLFSCPVMLAVLHYAPCRVVMPGTFAFLAGVNDYLYAWIGGLFGGTLFAIKWLYQSVAHGWWHVDRRLWRILSPHLSGGLAFVFLCIVRSGFVTILDSESMTKPVSVVAVAFLVGYFSDSALRKMQDVAESFFGRPDSTPGGGPKA